MYNVREISLPIVSTFEIMPLYIQSAGVKVVYVTIYRPGSRNLDPTFLTDFSCIVEHLAVYAVPVIIVGDLNVYLDNLQSSYTVSVNNILAYSNLVQLVVGPTHTADQ